MKSVPKLLPCAHCGSGDVRIRRTVSNGVRSWYVECQSCGIRTLAYPEETECTSSLDEMMDVYTSIDDAIECAVHVWNERVPVSSSSVTFDCDGIHLNCGKPNVNKINLDSLKPDELSTLGKRITDALVNRADKLFKAINDELDKMNGDEDDG